MFVEERRLFFSSVVVVALAVLCGAVVSFTQPYF